jgi:arylsulfatase A-like enzyme
MTEHDSWFDHAGLYDSVVHVPLAIRAPGHVRPQRIGALVQSVDVMPTVLELLGLDDVAHQASGDGISMTKLLRGEATEHRDAVMLSEATWEAKRGIRTKDWKLIRCYDAGIYGRRSRELYNVSADPDEQNNQIATSTDVARELGQRLDRWLDEHLQGRPDPLQEVVEYGLPAVARLDNVIREDAQIARRSSADADESLPVAEAGGQFLEKADRRRGVLRPGRSAARNVDPIAVDR